MNLEICRQIFEKYSSNFTTILSVGVELFQADGQTDRHDAANSFSAGPTTTNSAATTTLQR